MERVLMIGGAGYIGGITTDIIMEKGFSVTVYDNLLYESRFLKKCDFICGDIRDTKNLVKIHSKYDHIIWLAAIVGDGACQHSPNLAQEINVDSVKRFLDETNRRVIFTSTCSVYGSQNGLLSEFSDTNPLSVYAITKLETEKHVLNHDGLVFRLGTLFGLGDRFSRIRLDLVVNILTLRALKQKKLTLFGGEQWRPILAVRDVAGYIAESITRDYSGIYNLKYKNIIISDLAKGIQSIFPYTQIEYTNMTFEDTRNYRVDSSKSDRDFIFRPSTSIKEEVNKMAKLFLERRIKNTDDELYYNTRYVNSLINNDNWRLKN